MLSLLTWFHVVVSLVAIAAGVLMIAGFLTRRLSARLVAIFLATTTVTSVTGYLFPVTQLLPSHVVGVVSLLVLALTYFARYRRPSEGGWGKVFVIGSVIALYLNVFVAVVQSFLKIPVLKAAAPTQSEPPFKIAQLVVLLLFVAAGIVCVLRQRTKGSLAPRKIPVSP